MFGLGFGATVVVGVGVSVGVGVGFGFPFGCGCGIGVRVGFEVGLTDSLEVGVEPRFETKLMGDRRGEQKWQRRRRWPFVPSHWCGQGRGYEFGVAVGYRVVVGVGVGFEVGLTDGIGVGAEPRFEPEPTGGLRQERKGQRNRRWPFVSYH